MQQHDCPECDSGRTNRVHTEWYNGGVEATYVCDVCHCQFTVTYGTPVVTIEESGDET